MTAYHFERDCPRAARRNLRSTGMWSRPALGRSGWTAHGRAGRRGVNALEGDRVTALPARAIRKATGTPDQGRTRRADYRTENEGIERWMNELLSYPWPIVLAFMLLLRRHMSMKASGK